MRQLGLATLLVALVGCTGTATIFGSGVPEEDGEPAIPVVWKPASGSTLKSSPDQPIEITAEIPFDVVGAGPGALFGWSGTFRVAGFQDGVEIVPVEEAKTTIGLSPTSKIEILNAVSRWSLVASGSGTTSFEVRYEFSDAGEDNVSSASFVIAP